MEIHHLRFIREAGMALLGVILAVTPLAFWFVWSPAIYVAIVIIFVVSFVLLIALDWLGLWTEPRGGGEGLRRMREEAERLMALATEIDRLTDPRAKRKMACLRAQLWGEDS
ncbi:MAG: hypothetical protein RIM84_16230 [Alphaproteobacteria bacterium]